MKILYFAWVREKVGKPSETVELPDDIATISDLVAWLKTRGEEYEYAFENIDGIRAAVDQNHQPLDASISGAQEIAFFPPVTGG